jgi:hypothetical protein
MVDYSALSQRDDKLALELLEEHRQLFREIFLASTAPRSKPLATRFWSSENCAEICVTLTKIHRCSTCTGSDPCKNCRYCGRCAKGGGRCGVCK